MKIALVYTGTTPELIELVENEIVKELGKDVELISYEDPSILGDARAAGYVTKEASTKLYQLYLDSIKEGAVAILNLCSSVGEAADAAVPMMKYMGIPLVRVDEEMCKEAVRLGKHIGVMATLPTTLNPTKNTILRVARELGKHVEIIDGLVDGAFGLNQEEFKSLMINKGKELSSQVEVLLFAQGSMAYCEEIVSEACGLPVLSSPRFGAKEIKKALVQLGL